MNIFFILKQSKKIDRKTGFTLIEVMVAVSIFTIVMVVALGAILSIVNANRKAQALHTVINNVNLAIETMTRDLRTGYNYKCGPTADTCNWGTTAKYDQISFLSVQVAESREVDSDGATAVSYRRVEDADSKGYLEKQIKSEGWVRITDDSVDIEGLSFRVWGIRTLNDGDTYQPKIVVNLKAKVTAYGNSSEFAIQTFISQRYLDF